MNLQHLRFIQECVRQGFSLTATAQVLGSSQPAVSRGIMELEARLGVDIFVRHGKRLTGLTEPGKLIAARAEKVLAEVAAIERASADLRARDAGELRIATTHTQARYTLPPVVQAFRKRYPAVHLSLLQGSPSQIIQQVLDREVDFAIATEVPQDSVELNLVHVFDWQHVVVVPRSHPLAKSSGPVTLQALARYPLVTYVSEFAGRARIDAAFAKSGLGPDVVLAAIDSDVIKTYVTIGMGVGIMAKLAYDPKLDAHLCALDAGHLFGPNPVRLTYRKDAFLRGFAQTFINLFVAEHGGEP
jgi:LysR family cys regulon transcriptional activator